MTVIDVTVAHDDLVSLQAAVANATTDAIDLACTANPALRNAMQRLLELDDSAKSPFRLVAFPILGSLTGDTGAALPIGVVQRAFWAGAEALDDVLDGQFDFAAAGLSAGVVTVAATACITLMPQAVIGQQGYPAELETALSGELTRAGLDCAEGELVDVSSERISWRQVMLGYAGKTGAAYGRDAALAARLAGTDDVRGWRGFGRLFGVLRQLANDRNAATPEQDDDLANGTPTLLLAHALQTSTPAQERELLETRMRAVGDPGARHAVWERLREPDVAVGYDARITTIGSELSSLLDRLTARSDYRDLLHWMIDQSTRTARLTRDIGGE